MSAIPYGLNGHDSPAAIRQLRAVEPPSDAEVSSARRYAEEKVGADLDSFSEFIALAGFPLAQREPCEYFGPISTEALISEILMKPRATDEQIAQAWLEVRRRYFEAEASRIEAFMNEALR
jgi:hypothetical protein